MKGDRIFTCGARNVVQGGVFFEKSLAFFSDACHNPFPVFCCWGVPKKNPLLCPARYRPLVKFGA